VAGRLPGRRATCDLRRGRTGIEIPILLYMRNAAKMHLDWWLVSLSCAGGVAGLP